jgi:hypothetical protein
MLRYKYNFLNEYVILYIYTEAKKSHGVKAFDGLIFNFCCS